MALLGLSTVYGLMDGWARMADAAHDREARGRFVHEAVKAQLRGRLRFKHQGVDVVDLATGRKYEILSGTESNLARHGRRMAGELFRMLTF